MSTPLPHNEWMPRDHQDKLWNYLQDGGKRAMAVWHRRAGKDEVMLHYAAMAAMRRPANYVHLLPEFNQGRRSVWLAVNPHTGKRRIDECFPQAIRESTNDTSMTIKLINGSTWSVAGSDTYDTSLVGSSLAGIVFSEWALSNPSAWAYARPMVEENNGWAVFITTPRGRNHAHEMYKYVKASPQWFCELLTAEDTGTLSTEALNEARQEMVALYGEDAGHGLWRQEYFCDFNSALLGAFYASQMRDVREDGRILTIEPIAGQPVHRVWDLGMRDDTSIWMYQIIGGQCCLFDCISSSGASLEWWRDEIEKIYEQRGWAHGDDWLPHDAKVRELNTGRTRVETMYTLGLSPRLSPDASLQDGINAVRRLLPLCVFHPRCEDLGIAALEQYRREWNDETKAFKANAVHDWTSHIADSMRYLALAYKPAPRRVTPEPVQTGWRISPPHERRRGGGIVL